MDILLFTRMNLRLRITTDITAFIAVSAQKRADEAGRQATRTTNIYFFDHAKVAILSLKVAF